MSWKQELAAVGENAVLDELSKRGWEVEDLNARGNSPNVDLLARKLGRAIYIQVKTYNDYGWISGGGVNPSVCAGASLFNRAEGVTKADFIICLTPAKPGDKNLIRDDWRYFVMPTDVAEKNFRINIDGYFNQPKNDGTPRSKNGACQDFVGPGPINSRVVPDHHEDYEPYEGRFDLLNE